MAKFLNIPLMYNLALWKRFHKKMYNAHFIYSIYKSVNILARHREEINGLGKIPLKNVHTKAALRLRQLFS